MKAPSHESAVRMLFYASLAWALKKVAEAWHAPMVGLSNFPMKLFYLYISHAAVIAINCSEQFSCRA